jgi:hypothetical protein
MNNQTDPHRPNSAARARGRLKKTLVRVLIAVAVIYGAAQLIAGGIVAYVIFSWVFRDLRSEEEQGATKMRSQPLRKSRNERCRLGNRDAMGIVRPEVSGLPGWVGGWVDNRKTCDPALKSRNTGMRM